MELIFKAAAICLPAAVFAAAIKKESPALSLLLAVAAGCVILYAALDSVMEVTDFLREMAELSGVSSVVLPVILKTVGIAVLSRLAADICKDAGMASAASAAEFAGAVAALCVALPVMKTVFQTIKELI